MKIIIVSPLYPPDIATPAPYVKELATRLSQAVSEKDPRAVKNDIVIITYGEFPEKIPGVEILATSKRRPLFLRLFSFTILLTRALKGADVLLLENGASVELPVLLASLFARTPIVFHLSDTRAQTFASSHSLYGTLEKIIRSRAKKIIEEVPLSKPETLPFNPLPEKEFIDYENSWVAHVEMLEKIFSDLSTNSKTV